MSTPGLRAAERPAGAAAATQRETELRVQVARVDDAELSRRARRAAPAKSSASKPLGIATSGFGAACGSTSTSRRAASGVLMTMAGRLQRLAHPRQREAAMRARHVHEHLVERPRIAQVGDVRDAQLRRQAGRELAGLVRLHPRVYEVDVRHVARQRGGLGAPPARPRPLQGQGALRPPAPAAARQRLGHRDAAHLAGDLAAKRGVGGRPAIRGRPGAGDDDRARSRSPADARTIFRGRCAPAPPIGGKWYARTRARLMRRAPARARTSATTRAGTPTARVKSGTSSMTTAFPPRPRRGRCERPGRR